MAAPYVVCDCNEIRVTNMKRILKRGGGRPQLYFVKKKEENSSEYRNRLIPITDLRGVRGWGCRMKLDNIEQSPSVEPTDVRSKRKCVSTSVPTAKARQSPRRSSNSVRPVSQQPPRRVMSHSNRFLNAIKWASQTHLQPLY
eukprot:TRINITY_DN24201_c0_g1_i1.p1 TRINITY_DN24201_c0_g1~~TRINITY_DN24201_c0_g1_i1.p1  ORF type:complete len:142 (+),score=12.16 TRINITY_DN24201_c0_g1_i1:97-522(+)